MLPKRPHRIHSMIQGSLLRQSRVFYANSRFIPTASPKSHQIFPVRTNSLQERLGARYYNSGDTPKNGASSDGAAADASKSEIEGNDSIKKDLEIKNREIIDLKVSLKIGKAQR